MGDSIMSQDRLCSLSIGIQWGSKLDFKDLSSNFANRKAVGLLGSNEEPELEVVVKYCVMSVGSYCPQAETWPDDRYGSLYWLYVFFIQSIF